MRLSGVFTDNYEHISNCYIVSIIEFEQVHVSWRILKSDKKYSGLNGYSLHHFEKY